VSVLRIGSRGSALALWQANHIRDLVERGHGIRTEIVVIKTSGDRLQDAPISGMSVKGVFIKELEDALLGRRIDLAVHSMKDVPTEIPSGLEIAAITKREDARDCLVSRNGAKLAALPARARVGTTSLRRQSQLRRMRGDLDVREVRGNVDTRLRKVESGDFDAVVLAMAGLTRLGWAVRATQIFEPGEMLPAVGQGALGIETRADDRETQTVVATLDDAATRTAVTAERALLAELQGGCQVPLGAWGRIENGALLLDACVLSADGAEAIRQNARGNTENAASLGRELGEKLLAAGADRLLLLAGRAMPGQSG
jgi:hydroxymethylbilane synthase